ncbi:hypothetical protein XELAEV_18002972mg [Xenopus laevis]|uniref:Uncharacterized protein n=1 Tax=Xenopus laevis TaxID=8355 RepID=A0A974BNR7_XENLA|nr:hypothetical protein XELAEV_18002972mg [Xenopus laevis]
MAATKSRGIQDGGRETVLDKGSHEETERSKSKVNMVGKRSGRGQRMASKAGGWGGWQAGRGSKVTN